MKKAMLMFVVATMLVACGGNGNVEASSVDSTVVADSISVADSSLTATDSTVAEIKEGENGAELVPTTPAVK